MLLDEDLNVAVAEAGGMAFFALPTSAGCLITLVTPNYLQMTTPVAATIFAIFPVMTIIAVVIDRRALRLLIRLTPLRLRNRLPPVATA